MKKLMIFIWLGCACPVALATSWEVVPFHNTTVAMSPPFTAKSDTVGAITSRMIFACTTTDPYTEVIGYWFDVTRNLAAGKVVILVGFDGNVKSLWATSNSTINVIAIHQKYIEKVMASHRAYMSVSGLRFRYTLRGSTKAIQTVRSLCD